MCVCEVHTSVMVPELPMVACWQVFTQKDISRRANDYCTGSFLFYGDTITGMW